MKEEPTYTYQCDVCQNTKLPAKNIYAFRISCTGKRELTFVEEDGNLHICERCVKEILKAEKIKNSNKK